MKQQSGGQAVCMVRGVGVSQCSVGEHSQVVTVSCSFIIIFCHMPWQLGKTRHRIKATAGVGGRVSMGVASSLTDTSPLAQCCRRRAAL